jgi:hypothetical protein
MRHSLALRALDLRPRRKAKASGPRAARARASGAIGGSPGRSRPKVSAGEACWNGRRRLASSAPSELVENCPARGAGLVMPPVSIDAMNQHLAEISQCVGAIALRILGRCRLAQLAAAHCARQHRAPAASTLRAGTERGRPCRGSMPMSFGGRAASSSGCAIGPTAGYIGRTTSSSPTGHSVMATAEHRKLCERDVHARFSTWGRNSSG